MVLHDDSGSDPWATSSAVPASDSPSPPLPEGHAGAEVLDLDPGEVIADEAKSHDEKTVLLQKMLLTASSNGNVSVVHQILGGAASDYVDVNGKDDAGSTPLIYSSCFGHEAIVSELLRFGARPDEQDKHEWTALMWAINNHQTAIVKDLVHHGASVGLATSTGRSALNFVTPNSEIYKYLEDRGYIEQKGSQDFYQEARDPNEVEEELSKQFLMESAAANLDVDLAHLDIGDIDGMAALDSEIDKDYFVWERCLPDQMFVFNEADIPRILSIAITDMKPQRSRSQKPVPANFIFLSARYAHYVCNEETLRSLLEPVLLRIRSTVNDHKQDLAFLAFWLSNCSLLLYYLRKDPGLFAATPRFQEELSELITDIYVLITQDVEARIERQLDSSILDHDTIPGLDAIEFQSDWRIFRSKVKPLSHREEVDQVTRPPSPKRKAQPSPRNVTSILSSVLFVMDLYDVHPVVTQQIMSQILYWLGAVLFNRVVSNRKYLARSRAMQIRLNVSAIEDWSRVNNRRPEDEDEFGDATKVYPSIAELCRKHLSSLVQILQWLQCFTGFGDDFTNVVATLQQLTDVNPLQLLHVANKYRPEVGEKALSKEYKQYLTQLTQHYRRQHTHHATVDVVPEAKVPEEIKGDKVKGAGAKGAEAKGAEAKGAGAKRDEAKGDEGKGPEKGAKGSNTKGPETKSAETKGPEKTEPSKENGTKDGEGNESPSKVGPNKTETPASGDSKSEESPKSNDVVPAKPTRPTIVRHDSDDDEPTRLELYLDASLVLPFMIPTLREMIVSWGAGLGGTNKQRAKRYEPSLPTEVLDEFDTAAENDAEGPTSIFQDLTVPEKSVPKGWGDEANLDDLDDLEPKW